MRILMSAQSGNVMSTISSVTSALGKNGLGGALLGVGIAAAGMAVGIGTQAVKAAGDFQQQITALSTGAGESQKNLKMVSDGILAMAVPTGTTTKQLTDGMYMIESAGYHGAAGLDILKNAAEGAKVGNADLGTVANATTTIMTDFSDKHLTAANAVNTLVATVANGKTTMQDLSKSLSAILPTASASKVGLNDVMGAMSTMTGEGVPAANAATYLRQMITSLSSPSTATSKALKSIGLSAQDVSDSMKKSLPATLQMITDHLGKTFPEGSIQYQTAVKNIAGGSKQMQGFLDLTGQHIGTFNDNVKAIKGAVDTGGNSINGFNQVQQTFNFRMQQAKEVVEVFMIKLGQALLPAVNNVMDGIAKLAGWIQKIIKFFHDNSLASDGLKAALAGLAAGVGVWLATLIPGLIIGFWGWATAAGAAAIATMAAIWPFVLIGVVVAAIVFGIIEAVKNWGAIMQWFKTVWSAISTWFQGALHNFGDFFKNIWNDIINFFKGLWNHVSDFFKGIWNDITSFFSNTITGIKNTAANIFNGIVNFFKGIWNDIVNVFKDSINAVVGWFSWLYNHNYFFQHLVDFIRNVITGVVNWLKTAWKNVIDWIVNAWNGIVTKAKQIWDNVTGAVKNAVNTVTGAIKNVWNTVIGWLTGQWNNVSGFATTAWNNVTGAISTAFNAAVDKVKDVWSNISGVFSAAFNTYIATPLSNVWTSVSGAVSNAWNTVKKGFGDLWNSVSGFFGDMSKNALQWGANVIDSIGKGIQNAIGGIKTAVSNVASTISGWLGFHSPTKEGPGQELDSWPKNMMASYSKGLVAAIPQLQSSLNLAVKPIANTLGGNSNAAFSRSGSSGSVSSSSSTQVSNYNVTVNVSGVVGNKQEITAYIMKEMNQQLRSSGRLSPTSAGGKAV
jgi:TP901 family phage tail tape measure protein